MRLRLVRSFIRLLDWQLCSEEWAFSLSGVPSPTMPQKYELEEGERVDTDSLVFPSNHQVDIEVTKDGFVAKPQRSILWLVSGTMIFKGHAEMRNGAVYIIGTYRLPNHLRAFFALWDGGIISIVLLALPIAIMQGASLGEHSSDLISRLMFWFAFAGTGGLLLAFGRIIGSLTSILNYPAQSKLKIFLRNISKRDRNG